MYDLSLLQSGDVNFYSLILFGNNATEGLLVGGLMIAIFFVMLLRLNGRNEFIHTLMASSFVCFLLSGILAYIGLLGVVFPLLFLAILAFSALFAYSTKK